MRRVKVEIKPMPQGLVKMQVMEILNSYKMEICTLDNMDKMKNEIIKILDGPDFYTVDVSLKKW